MSETPSTTFLTDAQRRRARALELVAHLFPGCSTVTAHLLAMWIVTGRVP